MLASMITSRYERQNAEHAFSEDIYIRSIGNSAWRTFT